MANPTILPIATIIDCGALGLSFAVKDIEKRNVFNKGVATEIIPQEIYFVYESVKHRYDNNPNDSTLRDTSNLLWRLLGKYGLQALNDLQGGGQVIINNGAGLLLIPYSLDVVINSADFPSGSTSYTINWKSFGTKNTDIYVELQNQPVSALIPQTAGDFTYAVVFGLSTTTITFQANGTPTAPFDDQIMVIRGYKYA